MDNALANIVSKEECMQIVRNSFKLPQYVDIMLLGYNIKPASSDLVGFMGEYYILEVNLQDMNSEGEKQVFEYFIKTVPISNERHKAECERKGFFKKETKVYADILAQVKNYAVSKLYADCYYTRDDLMVLEDLSSPVNGFRHLATDESCTMAHRKVVLRNLAKLHVASLTWEAKEQFSIGERFKDVLVETQLTMNNEWYVTGIKGVVFLAKSYEKFQTPEVQSLINERLYKILCDVEELTKPTVKLRNVFCHGDSWDRNIFYKFNEKGEPVDCRLVDFQLARYSPPALDVLFFLYVNTSPEERHELYDVYLDFYYETFQKYLKDAKLSKDLLSKEDFLMGCRRMRLAVITLWAICEPLMKMPEGLSNKMRAEEQEKFDSYMNAERNEFYLRIMEIEPTYKETIMKPIEELIDYLLANEEHIYAELE